MIVDYEVDEIEDEGCLDIMLSWKEFRQLGDLEYCEDQVHINLGKKTLTICIRLPENAT